MHKKHEKLLKQLNQCFLQGSFDNYIVEKNIKLLINIFF